MRLPAGVVKGRWCLHFFLTDMFLHMRRLKDPPTLALSMGRLRKHSARSILAVMGNDVIILAPKISI
jgi:hypothetical protein